MSPKDLANRWRNWNHERQLKSLGPFERKELESAIKWQRLRPVDAPPRPDRFVSARDWITGYRDLPAARGALWQLDGRK